MSKVDIDIRLNDAIDSFGMPLYRPGSPISGSVTVYPNTAVNARKLEIRLAWHTEGRGSRTGKSIESIEPHQGELQEGLPQTFSFNFTLPNEPWSYEGKYITVVWAIEVQIDVPMGRDIVESKPFILAPDRIQTADW